MKRIGLFVIVFFCISLLLHASGPRVLFIGDSITDGNWGNACGMPKPTAERSLWDMNHIYGSGYMYLCASHYQGDFPEKEYAFFNRGMMVEGTVKNLTDFGAFIDLGGADGLLHISEMSWGRVADPKKLFKVGDKVNVMIKDIQDTKIALTLKLEENNPWKNAAEKYQIGTVVTGKVARMTDFGAFIELEEGIDALLHVSQIAIEHVEKPSDVLKVGQEITAKIVDFNEETKKISLSVKALEIEKRNEAADVEDSEEE